MKKIIIALLAFAVVQMGCSRTSDIIGPDACPSDAFVASGFTAVNNADNSANLDLLNSYAKITATFNETITYKVTISAASGALYSYDGKGSSVSLNWYGNSTNGKYFKQGDALTVKLTNLCKKEPLGIGHLTITSILGYNGLGYMVKNFDQGTPVTAYGDIANAPYSGSALMTSSSTDYVASPQGGAYYKFRANSVSTRTPINYTDANGNNITWYFGGSDFFTSGSIPPQVATLGTDPTRVYLNFFAKGQANSQAQMIFDEAAHGANLRRKFLANVGPEWTLYSVRLSDIGFINPSNMSAFSFNLGAALHQDTSAEVDLDLVIFTLDRPF